MIAVPALVFLNNPGSPKRPVAVVRTSARSYAGPGYRVLRAAEMGRRVPVVPPTVPTTVAPPTTEAPATTVVERRATTTSEAPATTRPRPTTTTEAPVAAAEPAPVAAKAPPAPSDSGASSGSSSYGGATWFHAPDGTCAHRTLAFGTMVTVTRVSTGASTTCRVADRGPFVSGMVIDLSMDTFASIASTDEGIIQVRLSW
jgi:rare lipoprotein A (peptidoglycan hydrolase)